MSLSGKIYAHAASGAEPFIVPFSDDEPAIRRQLKLIPASQGMWNLIVQSYSKAEDGKGYWNDDLAYAQKKGVSVYDALSEMLPYTPTDRLAALYAYLDIPEPKTPASHATLHLGNVA